MYNKVVEKRSLGFGDDGALSTAVFLSSPLWPMSTNSSKQ
jgi:hypothetical protein